MRPHVRSIDINALAQRVEVDNRISLPFYFRIADNLLKQARIYREEKNIIDLYIILLRYSSLLCETIPCHHEYQALPLAFKEKLLAVMNELESLKPEVQRQVDELNREHMILNSSQKRISASSAPAKTQILSSSHIEQMAVSNTSLSSWRPSNNKIQIVSPNNLQTVKPFQKISLGLLHPKEETLSRHSILGSNELWGHNARPITGIRVQYPSNSELIQDASSRLIQNVQSSSAVINEGDSRKNNYDLESVLSLDDGRWSIAVEESDSIIKTAAQEDFAHLNIRQPSPPPVLAEVQPQSFAISPSRVADPRPGPANPSQEGTKAFQHLHVPVKMMESFLRLAEKNTAKNLETCGILAGALKNRMFYVTTLIIPKQESTSDSCQTTDEEEIFNVQDKLSLFPLGWIHIMLPEAIAIVMAPTDTSRTHGIFHLTDPTGVNLIRNCQERGFHPHEEPLDGIPIYKHCSHVYMNTNVKFDVIDLRSL